MVKTADTLTAKIYLGLREGYGSKQHSIDEVIDFIQEYIDRHPLCVSITPTTYVYTKGREEGAIIGLINFPKFPTTIGKLEATALEIAMLCKDKFNQDGVAIEFKDKTILVGYE